MFSLMSEVSLSMRSVRGTQAALCIVKFVPFYWGVVTVHCTDTTFCLLIHLLTDVCLVSSCGWLRYEHVCSFYFSCNPFILSAFHFEIIVDSRVVAIMQRDPKCPSPSFHQWQHLAQLSYNITAKKLTLIQSIDLVQILTSFICTHMYVFSSVWSYRMCRFMWPTPQRRHGPDPSQGCLHSHGHFPLCPVPSP